MNETLISVIVPTKDRPLELERALESIALQQWGNRLEVIVVDDGSTPPMNLPPHQDLPGLRLVRNDSSMGAAAARNRGVSVSEGHYIAFLDDDDEWLPGKLDTQWEVLQQTGADFCYGGLDFITEGVGSHSVIVPPLDPSSLVDDMLIHDVIGFPSLILTRTIFEKIGGMDDQFGAVIDYDFCLRLALAGRGAPVREVLVRCYSHPDRPSLTGNLELHLAGRRLFLEKHAEVLARRPDAKTRHLLQIGQTLAANGRRAEARREFMSALCSGRRIFTALFHLATIHLPITIYSALGRLAWRVKGGSRYR